MKKIITISVLATLLLSNSDCKNKKDTVVKYKGRLEIKGICMNYTIRLLEGNIDTSLIATRWTDEVTNKHYKNVFALMDPCSFPETIKEGEDFYFTIGGTGTNCVVCEAYYPIPPKKLHIKVVDQ